MWMIVTCEHVLDRTASPDMLWLMDGGKIGACTCLPCAEETNRRHWDDSDLGTPDELTAICESHAQQFGIPVGIVMPDGFYHRGSGGWVRQQDENDFDVVVN